MPQKPDDFAVPSFPEELNRAYWKKHRSKLKQGQGVGKICDQLALEYNKVDWQKLAMKGIGEGGKGVKDWGGFTVALWKAAFEDAISEVNGACAKFTKKLFGARDAFNQINSEIGSTFKDTKAALTAMATAADHYGVAINKNSLHGPLKKYHDGVLKYMQEVANDFIGKNLITARAKLPAALKKVLELKDDVAKNHSEISGILYKACRDISQNTGNLAKVASKGLGDVDASVVSEVTKVMQKYGNNESSIKATNTSKDVENACDEIATANARLG